MTLVQFPNGVLRRSLAYGLLYFDWTTEEVIIPLYSDSFLEAEFNNYDVLNVWF